MIKPLTNTQSEIYDFIESYINEQGKSPSYYEIRDHFAYNSLNSVQKHINALIKKRYLDKIEGMKRGLKLTLQETGAVEIPLVGIIAAGNPIDSVENETVAVPVGMVKPHNNYYALRVRGDSMDNGGVRGIIDGDVILVKQQDDIDHSGQIAIVLNSRWEASLKKVYKDYSTGKLKLVSDNPDYKPMYWSASNSKIQGIYVGSLRSVSF